ncbi:hypothetical protein B5S33_g1025 [[Candida] boidinii]|nr:hypothetical protein B5S33_g1025 [[Candida] boidinii]
MDELGKYGQKAIRFSAGHPACHPAGHPFQPVDNRDCGKLTEISKIELNLNLNSSEIEIENDGAGDFHSV